MPVFLVIGSVIVIGAFSGGAIHARFGDLAFIALALAWGGATAWAPGSPGITTHGMCSCGCWGSRWTTPTQ